MAIWIAAFLVGQPPLRLFVLVADALFVHLVGIAIAAARIAPVSRLLLVAILGHHGISFHRAPHGRDAELLRQRGGRRAGSKAREPTPLNSVDGRNLGGVTMRGVLLWLVGIPIPIIILLYLFNVF
jgi:hypothetical protein